MDNVVAFKLYDHTCNKNLAHTRTCNAIDNDRVTVRFLTCIETVFICKAIKSHSKGSYNK